MKKQLFTLLIGLIAIQVSHESMGQKEKPIFTEKQSQALHFFQCAVNPYYACSKKERVRARIWLVATPITVLAASLGAFGIGREVIKAVKNEWGHAKQEIIKAEKDEQKQRIEEKLEKLNLLASRLVALDNNKLVQEMLAETDLGSISFSAIKQGNALDVKVSAFIKNLKDYEVQKEAIKVIANKLKSALLNEISNPESGITSLNFSAKINTDEESEMLILD